MFPRFFPIKLLHPATVHLAAVRREDTGPSAWRPAASRSRRRSPRRPRGSANRCRCLATVEGGTESKGPYRCRHQKGGRLKFGLFKNSSSKSPVEVRKLAGLLCCCNVYWVLEYLIVTYSTHVSNASSLHSIDLCLLIYLSICLSVHLPS